MGDYPFDKPEGDRLKLSYIFRIFEMPSWWNGRHVRLEKLITTMVFSIWFPKGSAGSIPVEGTLL